MTVLLLAILLLLLLLLIILLLTILLLLLLIVLHVLLLLWLIVVVVVVGGLTSAIVVGALPARCVVGHLVPGKMGLDLSKLKYKVERSLSPHSVNDNDHAIRGQWVGLCQRGDAGDGKGKKGELGMGCLLVASLKQAR